MAHPTKVQRVLDAIARVEYRPWQNVTVEDRDGLHIIRAERPGNVFVAETLTLYVSVMQTRTIEGTDIRMRASQSFRGGRLYRFGDDVKIRTWRDLYRIK